MLSIRCTDPSARVLINDVVNEYGGTFRAWLDNAGIRIFVLEPHERYNRVSATLAADGYPDRAHPADGVFVRQERTAYLRVVSRMSIAHECAHAYDFARGADGEYRSSRADIAALFNAPGPHYVTPYQCFNAAEYFAEAMRSLHPDANDPNCIYPDVSIERLAERDPAMYRFVCELQSQSPSTNEPKAIRNRFAASAHPSAGS